MSTASAPLPRPLVLADLLPAVRARDVLLVTGGVLLMALLAQVSVPVPGSPVPITGQTLGVVLTAAALGPVRGTLVRAFYILVGAVGLPVYSEASHGVEVVMGATGATSSASSPPPISSDWLHNAAPTGTSSRLCRSSAPGRRSSSQWVFPGWRSPRG
jgi:hypothetical protein